MSDTSRNEPSCPCKPKNHESDKKAALKHCHLVIIVFSIGRLCPTHHCDLLPSLSSNQLYPCGQ